jgi:hypothetical protein
MGQPRCSDEEREGGEKCCRGNREKATGWQPERVWERVAGIG